MEIGRRSRAIQGADEDANGEPEQREQTNPLLFAMKIRQFPARDRLTEIA